MVFLFTENYWSLDEVMHYETKFGRVLENDFVEVQYYFANML
jgi:hypothetical protein